MTSPVRAVLSNLGLTLCEVRQMPGGSNIPTWRPATGEHVLAVRLYPAANGERAGGRASLAQTLRGLGYPVPRILAVRETPKHVALAQEWAAGETLAAALGRDPGRCTRACTACPCPKRRRATYA